ncbi:MAG: 3-oxoacyl-ACP reductase FabG [Candidatus Rokubacteria bacterium]|nr:3-oxoacyl-ACP reductase FabG [Candidatus Rokubacteria bacterium]MBI2157211.1 3-oxoacyl-ACP reductase FabG [Candidatus Rokubacteria bacterium]MBI2494606.1 3-oxoacyl-ACP reductase FabG [Candidatus Rokubacteria bacterium]
MGRLDGRVALVTGASRGIGAAIARAFGREGARVAVNYHRSEAKAAAVVAAIEAAGSKALAVQADVADGPAVRAMVERAVAGLGPIDVLVNNAGIADATPLDQMSEDVWDRLIATNLRSVFLCTRAVLPAMLARGRGKIISVTSQLGQKGMPNHTHYAAAKAGVIGFTRALAREVGPRGIHVNAIAPGPIETDLMGPITDEFRREKSAIFALRRLGLPEEVAPTAVFLASDDSSYYAGQTLCPNGGDIMA